jgi:signal transduction histidine kinase
MKKHTLSLFSYTLIFVVITVSAVGALLYWNTLQRISDFDETQNKLTEGAVISTSNELSFMVEDLRRRVSVFAEEHIDDLIALSTGDGDVDTINEKLGRAVKKRFPNSFTFTVIGEDGNLLIEDFEGHVGQVCQKDIHRFADDQHKMEVYVHPNPLGYHFDIMTEWTGTDNHQTKGIFFVSFLLEDISRLLKNGQLPGHQLLLTKQDTPDLLEVTAQGGRNELTRDIRLNEEELTRIRAQKEIPGSYWVLSDLPPQGMIEERHLKLWTEAAIAFAVLLLISISILFMLSRIQRQLNISQGQLVQADKMASLGQMVAGIAHEMNTPLAYIRGNLEVTRDNLGLFQTICSQADQLLAQPEDVNHRSELKATLDDIASIDLITELQGAATDSINGLDDLKALVLDLKDFSRLDRKADDHVHIEHSIDQALNILKHELKGVSVVKEYETTPSIKAVPSQLNQVFLNLINNGLQAMDTKGGQITLRTRHNGASLSIDIEDNGHGIPANLQDKVFDPFFTTKAVGEGTGLGLSIVYKIIQQHGGTIKLHSTEGDGSCFTIELPVA